MKYDFTDEDVIRSKRELGAWLSENPWRLLLALAAPAVAATLYWLMH